MAEGFGDGPNPRRMESYGRRPSTRWGQRLVRGTLCACWQRIIRRDLMRAGLSDVSMVSHSNSCVTGWVTMSTYITLETYRLGRVSETPSFSPARVWSGGCRGTQRFTLTSAGDCARSASRVGGLCLLQDSPTWLRVCSASLPCARAWRVSSPRHARRRLLLSATAPRPLRWVRQTSLPKRPKWSMR